MCARYTTLRACRVSNEHGLFMLNARLCIPCQYAKTEFSDFLFFRKNDSFTKYEMRTAVLGYVVGEYAFARHGALLAMMGRKL